MSAPHIPALPPAVTPQAFLVARERQLTDRQWSHDLPTQGLWKVTGEAGAGVSSFLIDTAVNAITADPQRASREGIVLLTSSKESGARMRSELSERLAATGFTTQEPIVRSVHSLAFALLRQRTEREIRLISGAEQDAVIRQLLLGHAEDGGGTWPEELRPALPLVGFARQLRDFLLRAIERGLGPKDLNRLGEVHQLPIWSAAGDFLREYQQVMALTGALRFSAAELVTKVLEEELIQSWGIVLVDDAQSLAPASAELVSRLLQRASLGVVGGDLDQSIFRFRGASPKFFADLGGLLHNVRHLGASRRNPTRVVAVAPDEQTHHAAVVDSLRRAHFESGVDYRDMAVVVRSTPLIEPLRRALLHAGVPVALDPTDVVLAEQRVVVALLLALKALTQELTVSEWRELLLGPVGATDPVTLRRLLRGLRRWKPELRAEETLHQLLTSTAPLPDFDTLLTEREMQLLTHVRGVLDQGRQAHAADGSVEEVLWAVWAATGLSDRLLAAALRGGATGSQADRDLDAAMALFDAAGDFTERRPTASIELFSQYITEHELPTGVRDRRTATLDAVSLLTAHGVAGREFERVVVAGVQELTWPSLGETGTIFRQEDLIDLIDSDVDPAVPVPRVAERLLEEQRLFHVATTRATDHLLVTAVDDPYSEEVVQPSRFIEAFCAEHGIEATQLRAAGTASEEMNETPDETHSAALVRVLARDDVIAELRRAAGDADTSEATRTQAARQLARLAEAGVAGADPDSWWGLTQASTSEKLPLRSSLSPSRIESLLQCPMRAVLERMVDLEETMEMLYGSMAHAYFEALGRGVDPEAASAEVIRARREAHDGPEWKKDRDVADFEAMLRRIDGWLLKSRAAYEQVAVEADVNVEVERGLRISGRVDRLERASDGALRIVDLKTSANPVAHAEAEENVQLAAYQLAMSRGELGGDGVRTAKDAGLTVGSAVLVYPNAEKKRLTERGQDGKTSEELAEFVEEIRSLPQEMVGPELTARTGKHCDYCRVRSLCPVQPEGEVIHRG